MRECEPTADVFRATPLRPNDSSDGRRHAAPSQSLGNRGYSPTS